MQRWLAPETGGAITSIITTILAFLIGGVVVAATGHNPLTTYQGIFNGTGLNWLFPWVTGSEREAAAFNLQQTLLLTTTLIFTGLAVAFAFRCGLFNIGGQGQWTMGVIVSVWVGSSWADLAGPAHIAIAIVLAALAGAAWAGIAGFLKATVGAHEVITTIMLNWIAYWVGSYLFGFGGPLQPEGSVPISSDVVESARLPVFWGNPVLQGLHIGIFIAIGALVAYWLILSRTTLGFRVRAVGRNPEAARYGGISVAKSYFLAMAISGAFAGLGGAMDILGWQFRIGVLDIQASYIGYLGIAVALLGRNTAVGVAFAALLFGALLYGTSTRSLDPDVFDPSLAGNLTRMIQGLVLLFIGADVLILYLWHRKGRPRLRLPRLPRLHRVPRESGADPVVAEHHARPPGPSSLDPDPRLGAGARPAGRSGDRHRGDRPRHRRVLDRRAAGVGAAGRGADRHRGGGARPGGVDGVEGPPPPRDHGDGAGARARGAGRRGHDLQRGEPRGRVRVGGPDGLDAPLRDPADLRGGRRHVLRAQRRGEHRARGHAPHGLLLRDPGGGQARVLAGGGAAGRRRRRAARPRSTRSSRSTCAPTRS